MNIVKDLVTEYSIVDDTTWTFTIRDDVVFHNGDPLTSADVKYSIERAAKDRNSDGLSPLEKHSIRGDH